MSYENLSDKSLDETITTLLDIQQSLNINTFNGLLRNQIYNIIKEKWKFIYNSCEIQSEKIRKIAERTMCIFVLKFYLFFPDVFEELLIETSKTESANPEIIIRITNFIVRKMSEKRFHDFSTKINMFHLFCGRNSAFHESIKFYIDFLKRFDYNWNKMLLENILNDDIKYFCYKTIDAIVKNYPELISLIYEKKDLALVAYVISSFDEIPDIEYIDEILCEFPNISNHGDIDIYLQILLKSKQININVDDKIIRFEHGNNLVEFDLSKFSEHPIIYRFITQINLLNPSEDDSITHLTEKFNKISMIANQALDYDSIYPIFECFKKFVYSDYNQKSSPCYFALSRCINKFGEFLSENDFAAFLRRIILVKTVSWFQELDIMNILINLSPKYFELIGGNKQILKICVKNIFQQNEKLFSYATNLILIITEKNNYEYNFNYISKNIDFFDNFKIRRILSVLISIINKFGYTLMVSYFVCELIESLQYIVLDSNTLSLIFQFLSFFNFRDLKSLNYLFDCSYSLIYSFSYLISGIANFGNQNKNMIDLMKIVIEKDFKENELEELNFDYLKNALLLISKFQCVDKAIIQTACGFIFRFFPLEVTNLISYIPTQNLFVTYRNAFKYIYEFQDSEIVSSWCLVFLKIQNEILDNAKELSFFKNFAFNALSFPEKYSEKSIKKLSLFILHFVTKEKFFSFFEKFPENLKYLVQIYIKSSSKELYEKFQFPEIIKENNKE